MMSLKRILNVPVSTGKTSNVNVKFKGVENKQSDIKYTTSTKIQCLYDKYVNLDLSFFIFQKNIRQCQL